MDVPDPPVMIWGFRMAVSPEEGAVVRVTSFVKPLRGVMVIVDVPWAPALTGPTVVGLAPIAKSGVAVWTMKLPTMDPLCMKHQYV